jgi:transposase
MIPAYYDAPIVVEGSVPMRGDDRQTGWMFSYVSPEERVPPDHPLRAIRQMTDLVFEQLSPRFDRLYSTIGRPSIPPEKLLRALLLQGLYTVRSEALLMEQLQYNLLFRWFVGLSMDDPVWDATVFSKNRDRLLAGEIAAAFFAEVLAQAKPRASCRTSTSPSMGRCWRPGRARRVFAGAPRHRIRPMTLGIRPSISAGRGGRMTRISRPPIPMRACSRRRRAAKPNWRTSAIC